MNPFGFESDADMADEELEQSWNRTSAHLERAHALAASPRASVHKLSAEYKEYLDHNELGLALDTLETIGDQVEPPLEYWIHLENAALEMRLSDRAAAIRTKRLDGRDQSDLR